jgi:ribosomal protein S18 acetylase RimI-like enzyme
MTVKVRAYRRDDRHSLVQAIDQVCSDEGWMATTRFEPTPSWCHALEQPGCPHHKLLVAEAGGQVVGWCRIFPLTCRRQESTAELGIGLLPAHRRRGLGRALVRQGLAWAQRAGLDAVHLTTMPANRPAVHLFRDSGFVPDAASQGGQLTMRYNLCASEHRDLAGKGEKKHVEGT